MIETLKKTFIGRVDFYWLYDKDGVPKHQKEELTDDIITAAINGETIIGTSPFINDEEVLFGGVDFDVHDKEKKTKEQIRKEIEEINEDSKKLDDYWMNNAYAAIRNSSGSDGIHNRIIAPKPVKAKVMRAFIAKAQIELFGKIKYEIFPKQDELTEKKPYGNQMKLILVKHPKTKKRANIIIDDKNLTVEESIEYLNKLLSRIHSCKDIKCNAEDLKLLEKKVPLTITTNSSVPKQCNFIDFVASNVLLPSGFKTRHANLDANVHAYTLQEDKLQIREQYKHTQNRTENALQNWANYWNENKAVFNCGQIISYLVANKTDKNCKRGLAECRLCEKFIQHKETVMYEEQLKTIISLKDLLKNGIPEQEWYVNKFVLRNGVTVFAGTAGKYKTWVGMQLGLACATGTAFLNQYETKKCRVVYIDEENGNVTVPNRFDRLIKGHGLTKGIDNLFISIFNGVKLDRIDGAGILKAIIETKKPDVIIIDSMVRVMEGDEDRSQDVRRIFENIKPFLDTGIAFILLHHTSKRDTKSMIGLRGSGDFAAFSDVIVMFHGGQENFCNVDIVKNRHIEIDESCNFYFQIIDKEDNGISLEWRGQRDALGSISERCAAEIEAWIQAEKLDEFLTNMVEKAIKLRGYSHNCIHNALKHLISEDKIIKLKRGKYSVNKEHFKTTQEELV